MDKRYALISALLRCALVFCLACGDKAGETGENGGMNLPEGSLTPPICANPVGLADIAQPSATVGSGTPESCTEAALDAALAQGGVIVFNCGSEPFTFELSAEKVLSRDTLLDGEGKITLSGGNAHRIFAIRADTREESPSITLQRLKFVRGQSAGPNTEGGGGAIYRSGGKLLVLQCEFRDNRGPNAGQDVAGGAIFSIGKGATTIVESLFENNRCSNGGAVGNLSNDVAIVNSTFRGNRATGSGGNPGNGGNGGAFSMDGAGNRLTLCGSVFASNQANARGGAIFRVSNFGEAQTSIDRVLVEGNSTPDADPSQAGGVYLQGTAIAMRDTTVSNNQARGAGGLFIGPNSSVEWRNVTIAQNTALASLGGGVAFDEGVRGSIRHATFAGNRAPAPVAFAAATVGGGQITLGDSLIAYNEAGNGFNPISCRDRFQEGGGNLQFPVMRSGGGSDAPGALCTSGAQALDPLLGPLSAEGGPVPTMLPAANSPARGASMDCEGTDQRGRMRPSPCTSGAVEAP